MLKVVLSLDIGGTNTRMWLVAAETGKRVASQTIPTRPKDYALALENIDVIGNGLLASGDYELVAVGAGVAGAIKDGVITWSGNLSDWINRNFCSDLEARFNVPVIILNDCGAAALGEHTEFKRPLIYVIWGTGVGVAVVTIVTIDGILTVHVRETELGHQTINFRSRLRCGCGGRGHLEALVGGANLPKRFKTLFFRGRKAEELKDRHWNKVLVTMAVGLRTLSTSDPGLPIVMGGGVACKQSHRLPQLRRLISQQQSTVPVPELLLAKLGEDAGLVGAAYAARRLAGVTL